MASFSKGCFEELLKRLLPGRSHGESLSPRDAARRTEAKIDAIESEMSHPDAFSSTRPLNVPVQRGPTQPTALRLRAQAPRSVLPSATASESASAVASRRSREGAPSSMRSVRAMDHALPLVENQLPSALQEAAILHANGQTEAACEALRAAIQNPPSLAGYQALGWLMLLDLLRMTSDRLSFERLAADYGVRFQTIPPKWFEESTTAVAATVQAAQPKEEVVLSLPAVLGEAFAIQVDRLLLGDLQQTGWRNMVLDAQAVQVLELQGARSILQLIRAFEKGKATLTLARTECLIRAVYPLMESAQGGELAWRLMLQLLRLLGWRQSFDDLSVEYCSLFEVPPPLWVPPQKVLARVVDAQEVSSPLSTAGAGSAVSGVPVSCLPSFLSGERLCFTIEKNAAGCAQLDLEALRAFSETHPTVFIDCRHFQRIEFLVASDLLQLLTSIGLKKRIVIVKPNYPVYALFSLMGLRGVAEIIMKKA